MKRSERRERREERDEREEKREEREENERSRVNGSERVRWRERGGRVSGEATG